MLLSGNIKRTKTLWCGIKMFFYKTCLEPSWKQDKLFFLNLTRRPSIWRTPRCRRMPVGQLGRDLGVSVERFVSVDLFRRAEKCHRLDDFKGIGSSSGRGGFWWRAFVDTIHHFGGRGWLSLYCYTFQKLFLVRTFIFFWDGFFRPETINTYILISSIFELNNAVLIIFY